MNNTKVQSLSSVAFSWENQPGISKAAPHLERKLQLPPPPSPSLSPFVFRMNSAKKGSSKELDDPFLAAYMECTKSSAKKSQGKASGCKKKKGSFVAFSCKSNSGFVEDAVVRMSELPDAKERVTRGHAELTLGNSMEFKY